MLILLCCIFHTNTTSFYMAHSGNDYAGINTGFFYRGRGGGGDREEWEQGREVGREGKGRCGGVCEFILNQLFVYKSCH